MFSHFSTRLLFNSIGTFLLTTIFIILFFPLFHTDTLIIKYALNPFDICIEYPQAWFYIKVIYILFLISSSLIYSNILYNCLFSNTNYNKSKNTITSNNHISSKLNILIGKDINSGNNIYLPAKSLYQNILITGTIGSGKTSSAMYPFCEQLISYKHNNPEEKLGMLILDVKGNFYSKILDYVNQYNRTDDLIIISLDSNYKYNPLDKPNLKPIVLANRLKTILTLFSPNNTESYWLDKVEQTLAECIKLCRLYNNGYVTFKEIHNLITTPDYYYSKIKDLRTLFQSGKMKDCDVYNLLSAIDFFENEFFSLDSRTLSILKSEITRITIPFISDFNILNTFSPPKSQLNFHGFEDVLKNGKIVVLSMNISEYKNLSKIIATYLKLDFQSEVLYRLGKYNNLRASCFISDEYQEYITSTDGEFFSQSREAKCINIVATQSYSSLLCTLQNEYTLRVIVQNFINKLWFRTDDIFTIENIQKQLGKEDKIKVNKSISENASETHYNYFTNSLYSKKSNLSESISTTIQNDFIFDTNFFTQQLETFTCLSFLSDGEKILKPLKLEMIPYFIQRKEPNI